MFFKTYDAFSRLSINQINKLSKFIYRNQPQNDMSETGIRKAIQYAAKERPGFGGLVFTVEAEDQNVVAAAVLNKTGFEGYLAENMLVALAVDKERGEGDVYKKVLDYITDYCSGEISIQLKESHPLMDVFQDKGFEKKLHTIKFKTVKDVKNRSKRGRKH